MALVSAHGNRSGNGAEDTHGERLGAGPVAVGFHQHGKLVAAQARYRVGGSRNLPQSVRHFLENSVACVVTEAVIDRLEAVQIYIAQRYRPPETPGKRD